MKVKLLRRWPLSGLALAGALMLGGCGAAQPSPELASARSAYQRAARGPAAKYTQVQLHEAHQALSKAEAAAMQNGADDPFARDMAYIALRKAELAQAVGDTAKAERDRTTAVEQLRLARERQMLQAQKELSSTQQELAAERARGQSTSEQLQAEAQARAEAERKAQEALDKLDEVAQIREDARGRVISLSGSVLFASGKSVLLESAKSRLDQVAEALKTMPEGQKFVIEGHTDARGSDAMNQQLSVARAESVRAYLVTQGVPADRVATIGHGESQPVADNTTSEGRANNRRVEIVIQQPGALPAAPGTPAAPGAPADKPDGKKDKKHKPDKALPDEKTDKKAPDKVKPGGPMEPSAPTSPDESYEDKPAKEEPTAGDKAKPVKEKTKKKAKKDDKPKTDDAAPPSK